MHLAHEWIEDNVRRLNQNSDDSMARAAAAAIAYTDTLPNEDFYIHEASPVAAGEGHPVQEEHIKQFPGGEEPFTPGQNGASAGDGASKPAKAETTDA